jgi:hypothetical protein
VITFVPLVKVLLHSCGVMHRYERRVGIEEYLLRWASWAGVRLLDLGTRPAYMAFPAYVPTNVYPKTQEYTPEGSNSIYVVLLQLAH